jgi:hypothetical protein
MTTMSGTGGEGLPVAGLLVASVAVIGIMDKGLDAKLFREDCGIVVAGIIDKDLDVHCIGRFADGIFQCSFCIVGGHHDCDTLSVDH